MIGPRPGRESDDKEESLNLDLADTSSLTDRSFGRLIGLKGVRLASLGVIASPICPLMGDRNGEDISGATTG